MKDLETDHTGYLVHGIEEAEAVFLALGYKACGEPVPDERQRARLLLMSDGEGRRIELVEPFENNRSLRKMLDNNGPGPYHVCYRTSSLEESVCEFEEDGWAVLFAPTQAPALGGKRICYLWRREVGFIELVEK